MFPKLCVFLAVCVYTISGEPSSLKEAHKKCLEQFNLTHSDEISYWYTHQTFRPGKEHLKCFFECLLRTAGGVDSNSMPTKEKLNEMVERERKQNSSFWVETRAAEILASDIVLEKCLPPRDTSSACNIAYEFTYCVQDIIQVLDLNTLFKEDSNIEETDLRLVDLKSVFAKNVIPTLNACKRLSILEKDLF